MSQDDMNFEQELALSQIESPFADEPDNETLVQDQIEYELDEPYDYILEQQEREDFAQDGDFENMSAADIL